MYETLEFRHLSSFVAVAEACNFRKASEMLNISQPALTMHIKQLEDSLNVKLFFRGHAGASLTTSGRAFVPLAKQMLKMREEAGRSVLQTHAAENLHFNLGYSHWVPHRVVREAMVSFPEIVPGGEIIPSSSTSLALIDQVLEGRLDAALVSLPAQRPQLRFHHVCSEPMLVCLRKDDPSASYAEIPAAEISRRLQVMFERAVHPALYDALDRRLSGGGVRLKPSRHVTHPADMQFLVAERIGFGLCRASADLHPDLTLRPIAGVSLRIKTAIVCHRNYPRPFLPILAFRLASVCAKAEVISVPKKPVASATPVLAPTAARVS